jgi:hypothetical protein
VLNRRTVGPPEGLIQSIGIAVDLSGR